MEREEGTMGVENERAYISIGTNGNGVLRLPALGGLGGHCEITERGCKSVKTCAGNLQRDAPCVSV